MKPKFPHPGTLLHEEFIGPMGVTPYRLAKDIGVPLTRIAAMLAGERAITADTRLRLESLLRPERRLLAGAPI